MGRRPSPKIADMTDGFSGANTGSVVNTAVSIVLHEYLAKSPTPEEAAKHATEAHVMMRHFEEAVKKIKTQSNTKPGEKVTVPTTASSPARQHLFLFSLFYFCQNKFLVRVLPAGKNILCAKNLPGTPR